MSVDTRTIDEIRKQRILEEIEDTNGNLSEAADNLNISRQTIYNAMKEDRSIKRHHMDVKAGDFIPVKRDYDENADRYERNPDLDSDDPDEYDY